MITLVPSHESNAVGVSKLHPVPGATVRLLGQVSTGAVVSTIVIVCVQVLVDPQQSIAVQVRLTMAFPNGPITWLSLKVTMGAGSQSSIAMARPIKLRLVHVLQSAVRSIGHAITGGVTSGYLPALPALKMALIWAALKTWG